MSAPTRPDFFSRQPLQAQPPTPPETPPESSPLSSPLTPSEGPLFPRPLKIFKRPAQKASINLPSLSSRISSATIQPRRISLARTISQTSLESLDTALLPQPLSSGSTPSWTPDTRPSSLLASPIHGRSVSGSVSYCSLCENPLSTLQTYNFPKTAPAISRRIRELFPGIDASPSFCARCFEAIRAIHICWGCGEDVHRREERVGCGWAWWHWGCMRCLLCRVRSQ